MPRLTPCDDPSVAVIEVWKQAFDFPHPYPWRFAVTYQGTRHTYVGVPNQCASWRSAFMRAWWRARWLERGESRYRPTMTVPA